MLPHSHDELLIALLRFRLSSLLSFFLLAALGNRIEEVGIHVSFRQVSVPFLHHLAELLLVSSRFGALDLLRIAAADVLLI